MKANQALIDFRKSKFISQEELANLLGVSRQTVSRWEQGTFTPSAENLAKLSEIFGVPVDAFLKDGWTPPEEKPPEVQIIEVPVDISVPVEVPVDVPQPRSYRLWALLAAVLLSAGILIGALFFRKQDKETVSRSQMESEVINIPLPGGLNMFSLDD